MLYSPLAGVPRELSRVIMGTHGLRSWEATTTMLDAFTERGGNTIDTAYVYADGECERLLGRWMAERHVREDTIVITKGAHTPECFPETVSKQLDESLERLRTDTVEIYLLHRDNLDVPVGDFMSALEAERSAGRIASYGVSNWSLDRIRAANAYLRSHDLAPIQSVSNNFSLAAMIEPPWPGCVSSSTDDWRSWFEETQTALLPWSSQAQGFFAPGRVEAARDPEFRRAWISDANLDRRERAVQLATARGADSVAIALAYVLAQPFPTFALVGPQNELELDSSLAALEIDLDRRDVEWLLTGGHETPQ